MRLEILIKTVYGNNLFYPQCSKSQVFAKISKTITLDIHQLAWIKSLGYEIDFYLLMNGKPFKTEMKI